MHQVKYSFLYSCLVVMPVKAVKNSEFESKCKSVLEAANRYMRLAPDWVSFFRETLGVTGIAREFFPSSGEYRRFEKSSEFEEIQRMVGELRNQKLKSKNEPTRVITVRLPQSLHEALKAECEDYGVSMNKLCISKLLNVLILSLIHI